MQQIRQVGSQLATFVRARPVVATGISGVIAGGIGDTVAQIYEGNAAHDGTFSLRRLAGVMAFQGTLGPFLSLPLYGWLDRRFGTQVTLKVLAAKVVVDDFAFVPFVELPLFLTMTSVAEGADVVSRFQREYTDCLWACWAFNIPITILNFSIVPPPFRVIVLDISECLMTCVLSYVSHRHVYTPPVLPILDGDTTSSVDAAATTTQLAPKEDDCNAANA